MSDRFPPLAPQTAIGTRTAAKAMPLPSFPLLDMLIFGGLVVLMRLF